MQSLRDFAKEYVPEQTKNIADLKEFDIDIPIMEGTGKDKDGVEFKYKYVEVNGEAYRIPGKVIGDIKAILEKKPTLKKVSVAKKGQGLSTVYTVIPLD